MIKKERDAKTRWETLRSKGEQERVHTKENNVAERKTVWSFEGPNDAKIRQSQRSSPLTLKRMTFRCVVCLGVLGRSWFMEKSCVFPPSFYFTPKRRQGLDSPKVDKRDGDRLKRTRPRREERKRKAAIRIARVDAYRRCLSRFGYLITCIPA